MFFYVITVIIIVIFLNDNTNRVIGSNFDGSCIINRDYNNRKQKFNMSRHRPIKTLEFCKFQEILLEFCKTNVEIWIDLQLMVYTTNMESK